MKKPVDKSYKKNITKVSKDRRLKVKLKHALSSDSENRFAK